MPSIYDTLMSRMTDTPHTLDQYLLALWAQTTAHHELEILPIDLCLEWFIEALNAPVPDDDTPISSPNEEFNQWQNMVLGFAATFAEVKDIPQDDPFEFHGWMNSQPSSFLERGMAGTLGDEEEFEALTWEILRELLWSGKYYE